MRTLHFADAHTAYADHLYVGSDDRTVTVHDVRAMIAGAPSSAITVLAGHLGWVLSLQPGGDGRIVASSAADHTVRLWDMGASPAASVMTLVQAAPIWALAWMPETHSADDAVLTPLMAPGRRFATGSEDGIVRLYRHAGAPAAT